MRRLLSLGFALLTAISLNAQTERKAYESCLAQTDPNFSGRVGETVEMRGPVAQGVCAGKTGLRVVTANQIQVR